jgi:protein transport protein SEC20
MAEQIGKMAEDSQELQQGGVKQEGSDAGKDTKVEEQHRQEQPRNPKKRMWDENVEAKKYEERQKDEL